MRRPALAAGFRTDLSSPGWSSSRTLSGRGLTRHNFDKGRQKQLTRKLKRSVRILSAPENSQPCKSSVWSIKHVQIDTGIARPVPRVECVDSGRGGAVVLVSRARSFVWCVIPRGAQAFKTQAAAAAWWDVAWYVGRINNAARCCTTLCGPPAAGIAFY